MRTFDATALIDELTAALGDRGWHGGADMESYAIDWRQDFTGNPVLVTRPASTEEVRRVIEICTHHGAAIVTQGGNTGLSGGSIPVGDRPSVVVSTSRMRSIIDVDPHCFAITAEAGVTIGELQDAARAVDRQLAIDWGARGTATIGGAVSTDAGGINVLRYGTTRDQVLGLEVVLPDGRVWDGLRSLRKDASGYGLKHLFIGAEGTLGVVTKVVLKLEPRMDHAQSAFASVTDFDRLPELYSLARDVGQAALTAFELVPELGIAAVVEKFLAVKRPLASNAEWYVLAQFKGRQPVLDLVAAFLQRAADEDLITDAVVADTPAQEENLWTLRDELPPDPLFGVKGAKFDAAVPVNRVAEYYRAAARLARTVEPGAVPYAFGHIGDGNLHLYVLPPLDPPREMNTATHDELIARIDELTWSFGGTISAEHGIGQELRQRMRGQKSPVELELMRTIKDALDPHGFFNPGKLLP